MTSQSVMSQGTRKDVWTRGARLYALQCYLKHLCVPILGMTSGCNRRLTFWATPLGLSLHMPLVSSHSHYNRLRSKVKLCHAHIRVDVADPGPRPCMPQ